MGEREGGREKGRERGREREAVCEVSISGQISRFIEVK